MNEVEGQTICTRCHAVREAASDLFCRRCGTAFGTSTARVVARAAPRRLGRLAANSMVRMIAPTLVLALVLGGFMAADRIWLHVYAPDVSSLQQQVHANQNTETKDVLDLQNRVSATDKNVQNALNTNDNSTTATTDQLLRDFRIANSLTILALVSNYGGTQSSASAAGKACSAYLMFGTGSFTDCGFVHTDQ